LAERRLLNQIDDYIYVVNIMGAYQGRDEDRHKWVFWDLAALRRDVESAMVSAAWTRLKAFDWRPVEGADIARDWQILGLEAVK
jgi:hypothetical protein